MTVTRQELNEFYRALLNPDVFSDYCPNGMQIEGSENISMIAFAVSATRDSIAQAIAKKADAMVVHHGLFWKFHGVRTLTGAFARRVFPLVTNNLSLFAYHLPLDAHAEVGNAAVLGNKIDCLQQKPFGDYKGSPTGVKGLLAAPTSAIDLQRKLEQVLNHPVILASPDQHQFISSLGIITGGANSEWQLAEKYGLDGYITGEISEHDWHESQESGIHMFAGGHYATEQFGIQTLMERTQLQFDIDCFYIGSDNPV